VLIIAPELHMAPNVPVVTTSTSLNATSTPLLSTSRFISSAVKTCAVPFFIFSLISSMVRVFFSGMRVPPWIPHRRQIPILMYFWKELFRTFLLDCSENGSPLYLSEQNRKTAKSTRLTNRVSSGI
jgi:hypothetical protein